MPTPTEKLGVGLTALAPRIVKGGSSITHLARLSGGASQETWSFDLIDAQNRTHELILRRAPPGYDSEARPGSATEAQLMILARAAGVPSPHVLHVLEPADGIGEGFIMERVAGETIARKILRDDTFAKVRPQLARQCGDILARLHAIDPAAAPPLKRVRPSVEIDEMEAAYRADGQPRPVFELALKMLRARMPTESAPRLVHGDFRLGNFIVGPDAVTAVLDWELAHIGDPMRDLGWLCTRSWRFGQMHNPVGGFGAIDDLIAGYEAAGGAKIDRAALDFWIALGSLRWGVMCLGMLARFNAGKDASIERAMIARRASENEIDLLHLLLPETR